MAKDALREVNAHNVDAINKVAFMPKEEPKEETFFADGGHVETKKKDSDRLQEVNEFNKKKYNKKENLFKFGSNLLGKEHSPSGWYLPNLDLGQQSVAGDITLQYPQNQFKKNSMLHDLNTFYGGEVGLKPLNQLGQKIPQTNVMVINQPASVQGNPTTQVQGSNNSVAKANSDSNIKKAKDAVRQALGFDSNLGVDSDLAKWDRLASDKFGAKYGDAGFTLDDYMNGTTKEQGNNSLLHISKKANPFSKGNIGNTMKGIGGAAAAIGTQIGASEENPRGLFDQLDPVHALAGGRESAVGNAMSDAGVGIFQAGASTGQPYLMIAGAAMKILGGLSNAAFGIKEDKGMKQAADASINANRNFMSNASSFDNIKGPASMTNTNVYEDGWFTNRGADKNAKLAQDMAEAYSWADRSVQNNISNISSDQVEDFLRNYSAFGGYLTRPKRRRRIKR